MCRQYPVQIWLYKVNNCGLLVHGIKTDTYYSRCKTNNHWSLIKTHFQHAVGRVLVSLFGIKAANTFFTTGCHQSPPRLPNIHDQQTLTPCRDSISRCGRVHVWVDFNYEGGQYIERNLGFTHLNVVQLSVAYLNPTISGRLVTQNWRVEPTG